MDARGGGAVLTEHPPVRRVEDLLRELAPQVLGVVGRRVGDFALAEDAVQEALLAAVRTWPVDGVPDSPRAWLVTVAIRRALDALRSDASRRARETRAVLVDVRAGDVPAADDTLTLLLMCCHPSLTPASAVALTLRAVGGLTTAEVARAFLVPEATAAQRIVRAKATIRRTGARFELPDPAERPARLRQVMRVVYLVFTEGYAASSGRSPYRAALCAEGVRLARLLVAAVPEDAEATALLSLLLLLDSRRPARVGPVGELIPIDEQDRSRWDARSAAEGVALLDRALSLPGTGEYQLQAAIAALHTRASSAADTDWRQVLAIYGLLEQVAPTPVVTLNRAVATGHVDGPQAGLAVLRGVTLPGHRVPAVRGHLLELAGDVDGARTSYVEAAGLATNLAEQAFLTGRAARLATR